MYHYLVNDFAQTNTMNVSKGDITSKLGIMKLNEKKEINILLLGETGAGKSTFINSIFTYLQFEDFKKVEKEPIFSVLIPASFSIEDKNGVMRTVKIGQSDDVNENLTSGASATRAVKTYIFYLKSGVMVRLIDTPGMGDTRGINADEENCENILSYISRLHNLHAICYLTKSQQSRATVYFKYCVSQILSRLEKSAGKNIIFVFTHSKGSNYSAGDTLQLLRDLTEEIRKNPAHTEIPLDRNAFCFDNEAFRTLAAIKNGVDLSPEVRRWSIESWKRSEEQCWKMINYILELPPHFVHNTAAINEARRIIYQLSQPMADIAQLVNDNIQILKRREDELGIDRSSLAELKKKLYIPIIELVVTKLSQPVTVCTDVACTETYAVDNGKQENHYKTRCHDPCFLNNVPRDIIGSPELMNCACIGASQHCTKCGHSYRVHMHVYYFTVKKQIEQEDEMVSKCINTKELLIQNAQTVIANVRQRKNCLENELNTIVKCNAKFAHFLSNNAIAPFSDHYAEYIEYLMSKERRLGTNSDPSKLEHLRRLLREHTEMKKVFADAAEMQKKIGKSDAVTPQDISKTMTELFNLNFNGKKIKEMFDSQKKTMGKEYTFSEYLHTGVFGKSAPNTKEVSEKKKNDKKPFEKNKGPSSAVKPTTKVQRGRPNNHRDDNQQRNRGRSAGPHNAPKRNSPPPPYDYGNSYDRYQPPPNLPLHNRGVPASTFENSSAFNDHSRNLYPQPGQLQFPQAAGIAKHDDSASTIQVHLTLPAGSSRNENAREQSRDLHARRDITDTDYYAYDSRGPPRSDFHPRNFGDYFRDSHPPMQGYLPRDLYAYPPPIREHYPPRDAYPSRHDYPPRNPYVSRDSYPMDPSYVPRERECPPFRDGQYPRDNHPSQRHYADYDNRGGQRYDGQTRNHNYHQKHQNNFKGVKNYKGNVVRQYKKKNNKPNRDDSNSGNDSDTSAASGNK
ncbi:uncharacterized protein [Euwallacea fornicatus]|uniref:uncharacterized protein isoform X2 n=1 Tax=Euwallacea fornicatus TaxID=995702 RepID=UPI0033903067